MKKELIKNDELKKVLEVKCSVFDFNEINDEDLEKIQELNLRAKKLSGENVDFNFDEILYFDLKTLSLTEFKITQNLIEKIFKLNLENLYLYNCEFDNVRIEKIGTLKNLTISGGKNVDKLYIKSPENITIVDTDVDFTLIDNSEVIRLNLINCNIKNMENLNKYLKLENVILDGSKVSDLEGKKLNSVDDIVVNDNVSVSFEEEFIKANLD